MSTDSEEFVITIARLIQRATHGRIGNLVVESHIDGIVLKGTCPTYDCKKIAQDVAMQLVDDTKVVNEIQVR